MHNCTCVGARLCVRLRTCAHTYVRVNVHAHLYVQAHVYLYPRVYVQPEHPQPDHRLPLYVQAPDISLSILSLVTVYLCMCRHLISA